MLKGVKVIRLVNYLLEIVLKQAGKSEKGGSFLLLLILDNVALIWSFARCFQNHFSALHWLN